MDTLSYWYALYTRSRAEKAVHGELVKQGVVCFLPLLSRFRQWKDRKKRVEFPLFPGYLFIQICPTSDEKLKVMKIKGAVHILGITPPSPIPATEIHAIRTLLERPELLEPHAYLEVGRRVRVVRGVFTGIEGILIEKRKKSRLVVSIGLLKQAVAAEVAAEDVEPV